MLGGKNMHELVHKLICGLLGSIVGFLLPLYLLLRLEANRELFWGIETICTSTCGIVSFWRGQLVIEKLAKALHWLLHVQ